MSGHSHIHSSKVVQILHQWRVKAVQADRQKDANSNRDVHAALDLLSEKVECKIFSSGFLWTLTDRKDSRSSRLLCKQLQSP